jgi:hypothetical protein
VELLTSDVHSGFALPLPTKAIFKIPDAVLAPVGIANQLTISDDGEVIAKNRLTHDQTFKFGPEKSLNNRMRMSEVNPVAFGWCLSRLLHYIVDLQRRHPSTKIFLMTEPSDEDIFQHLTQLPAVALQHPKISSSHFE